MTPEKKQPSLDKTAKDFAVRLAKTMAANDPAADAAFQKAEAERDAKVSAALKAHLAKKKPAKK
ncbi:MAG: hypothetical protein K1X89_12615 [Myxococcaceae bacterium]|nr:hypothetical protein [Myxococcaceae bacterium]